MKKFFLFAAALMTGSAVMADTESYVAAIDASTMASVFPVEEITSGSSVVSFGTANMDVLAVGGATPKTILADGTVTEWNAISWQPKNTNLQDVKDGLETPYFFYVLGTGNPCVDMGVEEIIRDGEPTGEYRATYVYYGPEDGGNYKNEMPIQGLYYKFTPKVDGTLKIQVWSNKGNRNTYVVEESSKQPVAYTAEGYINGQNEQKEAVIGGETVTYNAKKYLTAAEIQDIHNAAKVNEEGVDTAPYVIGAGNQPFWGYLFVQVEAGKTYWLFQDSSQIGFGGYEFTFAGGEQPQENYTYYTLTFPEVKESYADGDFSMVITDNNGKFTVDDNSQYFGNETSYEQFTTRLKTGGKSSSNSFITVNIPVAGKLQIMARSASSSSVRALVVTQNEAEIYNGLLDESNVEVEIEGAAKKVFKVHETNVEAGTADITYPDGAINFYCVRLAVPEGAGIESIVNDVVANGAIFNLRGQRVNEMTPGQIYIVNGKKVIR
jgi:hypothetical protein